MKATSKLRRAVEQYRHVGYDMENYLVHNKPSVVVNTYADTNRHYEAWEVHINDPWTVRAVSW